MEQILMACGCVASGKNQNNEPICLIHIGIDPGAIVVKSSNPDLTGRKAKCTMCDTIVDSSLTLAFFKMNGFSLKADDEFYCGCRGWD